MKKWNLRSYLAGVVTAVLILGLCVPAIAAAVQKQLTVTYKDIKICIDGTQITPKDANGNVVEPFVSGGTTYLPVRAVGEAFGKEVTWDSATNTVYVGKKPDSNNTTGKNTDIEITGATLDYSYSVPTLYLDFKNNTGSDITRFDIYIVCYDAYGKQVGNIYKGYSMEKLLAGDTGSQYWDLLLYNGVQEVHFGVYKYQTLDGKTVEIEDNNIKWLKTSY